MKVYGSHGYLTAAIMTRGHYYKNTSPQINFRQETLHLPTYPMLKYKDRLGLGFRLGLRLRLGLGLGLSFGQFTIAH